MEVLLLGNGFDIYHNLPTRYVDFLHTVNFLINNYTSDMDTIGKVYSNDALRSTSWLIDKAYETYKNYYDTVLLDSNVVKKSSI